MIYPKSAEFITYEVTGNCLNCDLCFCIVNVPCLVNDNVEKIVDALLHILLNLNVQV